MKKTGTNYANPIINTYSISGATSSKPMVVRARATAGGAAATGTANIYTTGSRVGKYNSGFGIVGEYYFLRMQNTTGGPTVTTSGQFTA